MGSKNNLTGHRTQRPLSIFAMLALCCFFYLLGAWQRSGSRKEDSIALNVNKLTKCNILPNLSFESHQNAVEIVEPSELKVEIFKPYDAKYIDYTPCQEQDRAMTFPRENMIYRERHCLAEDEKLRCLIPAPKGYTTPFPWPKSRDYAYYANVPYKSLTVEKAVQNWVQFQGTVFKFPGGGTMFPQGANAYIDELALVISIADGSVRTALDTGCGALVQFSDVETATSAKDALDGRSIPSYLLPEHVGPCTLRITYSGHTDLSVKFQSHRSRDYTNPYLPVAPSSIDGSGQMFKLLFWPRKPWKITAYMMEGSASFTSPIRIILISV